MGKYFYYFCTLNLFSGVFNNGMIKYENDRDGFLSSMQGLVSTLTLCMLLLYLLFLKNYHYGLKSAEF